LFDNTEGTKGYITPVSKDAVLYSVAAVNVDDPDFFILKKHDFSTDETEELGLGETYVEGMAFIEDTETLLLWASELGSRTDFLMAADTDLNVKWKTDDLGVRVQDVLFSDGRYYVFAGIPEDVKDAGSKLCVIETDPDGKVLVTHEKYAEKNLLNGFVTLSEDGGIIFGGNLTENGSEQGVVMLCGGEEFFPDEYIALKENHFPADGVARANELLSMSYNTANNKMYLDFIDTGQAKTLRSVDLSKIFRKYGLTYLGHFAFEKEGAYIRAVGGIDKKSKYYKRGIRSLFFYFDAEGNPVRTVGVKLDLDFEIYSLYIADEDDRALYCVARDYNYAYDKLLAFEIDKADLRQ
jgi:hypothetical protein